jgi:hypothetical protein
MIRFSRSSRSPRLPVAGNIPLPFCVSISGIIQTKRLEGRILEWPL